MSILDNTRAASFKGIPFLVRSSSVREGRNKANYLYINTGRRVSKDLGELPSVFTLECFTHSIDGDEYEQKRDALRTALRDKENGLLVHPFLGNFNVCSGVYTFTENFTEAGVCRFQITFEICDKDENPVTPSDKQANPAQIKELALTANRALQDASAAAFVVSTPLNQESSKSLWERISEGLADIFGPVASSLQKFNEYATQVNDIAIQASYYANNPIIGFATLADGVLGVDGLTIDTFAKFKAMQNLFDFGNSGTKYSFEDASPVRINDNPTTNEDAERNTNTLILRNFQQAAGTIDAFAQAGNIEYSTTEEIDSAAAILEEQFDYMRDNLTASPDAEVYDFDLPQPDYTDTYEAMKDLRTSTLKYFEQQRLTAARVEIIKTHPVPASVLAYTLYGDSDRATEILELNGIRDNMALSGVVKVLSE